MSEISGFAYSFFVVALSLILIILLAIFLYYTKVGDVIRDLFINKEEFESEIQNVFYYSNAYKRKIQRAREMLTLAYIVNNKTNLDSRTIEILSSNNPLLISQPNNIFHFMERIFEEIMVAEDELQANIKLANKKLRIYNIYIQTPYLPRMMAAKERMMREGYDNSRLSEIERDLDSGLANISLLEEEIRNELIERRRGLPQSSQGKDQNDGSNQIEITGNKFSRNNDLEFLGPREE